MTAAEATGSTAVPSDNAVLRLLHRVPLRMRLVAILLVLLFTALTLTVSATAYLMRGDLLDRIDTELRNVAAPVAAQALEDIGTRPAGSTIPTGYAVAFLPTDGRGVIAINPTGQELHPAIPKLPLDDPRVQSGEPFTVGSTDGDLQWRMVAGRLASNQATFVVGVPLDGLEQTVHRLVVVTSVISAIVLFACAVIGWYAVRRAFRPLTQIEDTAAAIASGDLSRRMPVRATGDEVSSLAQSLNAMLAQIERSFAVREASEVRMRQFVTDASHELRTPLATVRGYAELYRQGAVRDHEDVSGAMNRIEGEASRMSGLVEDLLMLARLDDERPLERLPVDLTVVAADAVQDARARDPERRISLVGLAGPLAPTTVGGDEPRLRQVLGNLLTNAIAHTPPESPIEVAVGVTTEGVAGLEVRDHGRGIDPGAARRVFERFFRADPARSRSRGGGSGLGLAIVAAIVQRHGGRVGVGQTPGGGATFVVHLPSADSQGTSSVH